MAGRTITSMAVFADEYPISFFVGREDGSVDFYASSDAACHGKPVITFYGHTKAVTAIVAPSVEEIFTSSMDGTVRQWSTDREQDEKRRCLKAIKFLTPLRCLAIREDFIYSGGDNGCLNVMAGSRRSIWPGHKDVLSCITFVAGASQYVITGGYDNQIRVWDAEMGKTICLLIGHQNHVKSLRVAASGELLFSFGRDLALKIWRLPEFGDEMEDETLFTQADVSRQATVSFREPDDANDNSNRSTTGGGAADVTSMSEELPGDADAVAAAQYRAAMQGIAAVKSAIRARPEPPIRQLSAVGTIELPESPLVLAATSDEAAYCFVGTSNGYVLGINVRLLSRSVLQFLSCNSAKMRADTRETLKTLRLATRAIKKRCAKAVLEKQRELVRAAKKALENKKAQERKERAEARAAARAEREAARAAEEDDEESEELAEEDELLDTEEESEEQIEDEEEEEDPLALLDDEQREELATFRKKHEEERDSEIEALKKNASERNKTVKELSATTFDTKREQFFRLNFTSYKKVGTEAVQALVAVSGSNCFAVQSHRVMQVDATPGITYL